MTMHRIKVTVTELNPQGQTALCFRLDMPFLPRKGENLKVPLFKVKEVYPDLEGEKYVRLCIDDVTHFVVGRDICTLLSTSLPSSPPTDVFAITDILFQT